MKFIHFKSVLCLIVLASFTTQPAVGMQFFHNLLQHGKRLFGLPASIKQSVNVHDRNLSFIVSEFFNYDPKDKKVVEMAIKLYESKREIGKAFIMVKIDSGFAYLRHLHIALDKRRNGFGSFLLKAVFSILKDAGFKTVYWHAKPFDMQEDENVRDLLPQLIDFYQHHGGILDESGKGLWPRMYRIL